MARRRYHYDAKGNLKGSSSDTRLAGPKDYKFLALMLFLIPIGSVLFGISGTSETRKADANNSVESSRVAEPSTASIPAPVAADDVDTTPTPIEQPTKRTEASDAPNEQQPDAALIQRRRPETTKEYLERTYVNGDLNCPRDVQAYIEQQCREGDEQQCRVAAQCGSDTDRRDVSPEPASK